MYISKTSKGKFYHNGEEITETKYNKILSLLHNRPTAEEGFAYRLTADLEWELYEVPVEEEAELTEAEALEILLGGAV
ncbi:MAG: hypothetical protein IJ017_04585 [Oscillospiraceae bacterium]|nr:hypothetical protein [Oscillospiraceae bacterium]